jgi:hypothetical protein
MLVLIETVSPAPEPSSTATAVPTDTGTTAATPSSTAAATPSAATVESTATAVPVDVATFDARMDSLQEVTFVVGVALAIAVFLLAIQTVMAVRR